MHSKIREIGRFIASKLLPVLPYPVLRGPLKGIKFILGSISGPGKGASVYLNMVEEKQTNEFIKHINKNSVIFDIGANVGYYSLLAAKLATEGKVLAFEPVLRNLHFLYKHNDLNNINNILVIPLACSDSNSLSVFSFDSDAALGHLIENENYNIDSIHSTIVHTITVDKFVEVVKFIPDILKIDVEGAELLVLKGASDTLKKCKPKIFLSIHSTELEIHCVDYLRQLGYETKLIDEKERPSVEYYCYYN